MSDDANGGGAKAGALGWLFQALSVIAGLMVAAMMFITTIDVVGRYFFGRPLYAAFEMTEILMALIIFAGMPLATAAREHISVTIVTERFSEAAQAVGVRFFELICALTCFVMGWRMWVYGARLWRTGDQTLELRVPIGLLAQIAAVLVVFAGLAFLINAVRGRQFMPGMNVTIE